MIYRCFMSKERASIQYRQLANTDLHPDLLKDFKRYQEVKQCWQKKEDKYVLKEVFYIEDWNQEKRQNIVNLKFNEALNSNGFVFAAYDKEDLVGFATIFGKASGSLKQYLLLDYLYVSNQYRHQGIGKELFLLCVQAAVSLGVSKLYISANPAAESQAFYRKIGCVEAEEVIKEIAEELPKDIPMEYQIV